MLFTRLVIILLFITFFHLSKSQSGFIKSFDNDPSDVGVFLDLVNNNDTLVLYGVLSDSALDFGIGFLKIDTFGNVLKKKLINDPDTIWTSNGSWSHKKLVKTTGGFYAIVGGAIGLDKHNVYFMQVDQNFNLVTLKYLFSEQFIYNSSFIEDASGYLVVCYVEQPNNSLANDILLIKLDHTGNEIWRKKYGKVEYKETPGDITKINNNLFVINGGLADYPSWGDPSWPQATWSAGFMFAIDSLGNEIWRWNSDTTHLTGGIFKALPLIDEGWMCISLKWELFQGGQHTETYAGVPMIVRLDKDLNIVWEKEYGFLGHFHLFQDLEQTADGNFLASGFLSYTEQRPQGVHFKFTPQGDSLWMRLDTIYPLSHTRVQATEILSSGSIISIGYAHVGPYGQTGFIMKLSPDGCMDTLNCFPYSATDNILYDGSELLIYPNPAEEQITIELSESMPRENHILIRDVRGSTVYQAKSSEKEIFLNTTSLIPGQYFVEVNSGRQKVFGKFVKIE